MSQECQTLDVSSIRATEVLAALSLTTDLATGAPLETGLACCLLATQFARGLGFDDADTQVVFHTALLSALGCTAHASENAEYFVDDIAFQSSLRKLDPGDPSLFAAQLAEFGSWAGASAPELSRRFIELAPTEGPLAAQNSCEVSRALGPRLGLAEPAVAALADVHERWDGLGVPGLRNADAIPIPMRILHVVEQVVHARARGGAAAVRAELSRRSGRHLDPDLVSAFLADADTLLAGLDVLDLLAAVVAAEPGPAVMIPADRLDDLCLNLAIVVDLKGRYLLGHSAHVAALAEAAAALTGMPADDRARLRAAALLHDLGRAAVPAAVWDRPGPLSSGEWELVRLHAYWTGRILQRCPALAELAPIAAGHHERGDGSGYHRGARTAELSPMARMLGCADAYAAATEERPYRPALTAAQATAQLTREAAAGRLDREATAALIEAAGQRRPQPEWPCGLTDREVEVLRLAARGLSNHRIAEQLVVSDRTVGHHLAHIYDKTDRRTRAGAAVFAMEHGLLG